VRIATGQAESEDGGVPGGDVLRPFVTAVLDPNADVAEARQRCVAALGAEATAQAATVIASFDGINRVADATGIRLDPETADQGGNEITQLLGYEELAAARS